MITTWDGKIWYPQFYDLDTQLGLDNSGFVRFGASVDFADHSENKLTISQTRFLFSSILEHFDRNMPVTNHTK